MCWSISVVELTPVTEYMGHVEERATFDPGN